jgi:hypothetical protein
MRAWAATGHSLSLVSFSNRHYGGNVSPRPILGLQSAYARKVPLIASDKHCAHGYRVTGSHHVRRADGYAKVVQLNRDGREVGSRISVPRQTGNTNEELIDYPTQVLRLFHVSNASTCDIKPPADFFQRKTGICVDAKTLAQRLGFRRRQCRQH